MPYLVVIAQSDVGAFFGLSGLVVGFVLAVLAFLALLIAVIVRVSSRRFTSLIYGPAVTYALFSIIADLLGSMVCYAFEQRVFFEWAWHAGQSGVALLIGAIALALRNRRPKSVAISIKE